MKPGFILAAVRHAGAAASWTAASPNHQSSNSFIEAAVLLQSFRVSVSCPVMLQMCCLFLLCTGLALPISIDQALGEQGLLSLRARILHAICTGLLRFDFP
jgi:hypothetical protein